MSSREGLIQDAFLSAIRSVHGDTNRTQQQSCFFPFGLGLKQMDRDLVIL